jgi:nucleotide-binding universal stress UspA family protein
MFKHLLVPLDGSGLAEAALPPAAYLAQKLDASVTLVHIIERGASAEVHGQHHLTSTDEAHAYLADVAGRAFPSGQRAERHVHTTEMEDVALGIANHIEELRPDLIVMCTHGRGGLRDVLYGSIAQQVVARGTIPVLLIQPSAEREQPPFLCRRLLVPLDGTPEHEQALEAAVEIAQPCRSDMHLVLVVPTLGTLSGNRAGVGRLLPGATTELLELSCQEAEAHLLELVKHLQVRGLPVTAEVARGDPATTIIRTSDRVQADMIVLGTHGKAGVDAFWSRSIAPKVLGRSRLPLLLVPVTHADQGAGN